MGPGVRPQSLHGESIVAVLLRADDPMSQSLLRGELRWDGNTLWLEWYSGGLPLPFSVAHLDRTIVPMTAELRASLVSSETSLAIAEVLANVNYFSMLWVTASPPNAIPAYGIVGVAGHPSVDEIIDVEKWATRHGGPG